MKVYVVSYGASGTGLDGNDIPGIVGVYSSKEMAHKKAQEFLEADYLNDSDPDNTEVDIHDNWMEATDYTNDFHVYIDISEQTIQ